MKFKTLTVCLLSAGLSLATVAWASSQDSSEILSPEQAVHGEPFTQGNNEYVLMPDLVGVIQKFTPGKGFENEAKNSSSLRKVSPFGSKTPSYSAGGFEIYKISNINIFSESDKKFDGPAKYRVVLRKVIDAETNTISYKPGFLTGNIVVKSRTFKSLNTPLALKKSFSDAGFFIYELPHNQTISSVLSHLNKNPEVESASVEIIENLKVPM